MILKPTNRAIRLASPVMVRMMDWISLTCIGGERLDCYNENTGEALNCQTASPLLKSYYEPVKNNVLSISLCFVKEKYQSKVDKTRKMDTIQLAKAEVAELADALGSGLSSCKGVRVQVPPSAPKKLVEIRVFYFNKHGPIPSPK